MHVIALAQVLRVPSRRRRALEAAGWRTWLTYTENHRRDVNGRMVALDQRWLVELEHVDGASLAVQAPTTAAAWEAAWSAATANGIRDESARHRVREEPA
jgi:hypothetical protein